MSKLVWDVQGEKQFETGVKDCALYVMKSGVYGNGVAWNGITGITESPSGADTTSLYADDAKYLNLQAAEEFGGTIKAYMSPVEFDECDGSASIVKGVNIGQQNRSTFGLVYKTTLGNDTDGNNYGYKLHIVYGATASPSSRDYATINDSPSAMELSWEFKTSPVPVAGHKPTATVTINSVEVGAAGMKKLEDALYGSESTEAKLLTPDEILALLSEG